MTDNATKTRLGRTLLIDSRVNLVWELLRCRLAVQEVDESIISNASFGILRLREGDTGEILVVLLSYTDCQKILYPYTVAKIILLRIPGQR